MGTGEPRAVTSLPGVPAELGGGRITPPVAAAFVPGRELARAFYHDVLSGPIGALPHAAALLGQGSEVLGFDTARSTDHSWGPRAQIFVEAAAVADLRARLDAALPATFHGWPVRYYRWQTSRSEHHVEVTTLAEWLLTHLGRDPRPTMPLSGWLSTPQQLLLEVTSGLVFHDDTGEVTSLREMLRWYPHDLWLWLMAAQWARLAEQESFLGRTAELGDDLGARLIAGRIAHDAVQLCFVQERRYAPYTKWLGSAFTHLTAAAEVGPLLHALLAADANQRAPTATRLYRALAQRHNALGVTLPLPTTSGPYDVAINDAVRPYQALNARRFGLACEDAITDETLRHLAVVGAVDQLTAPTDLLIHFTEWPQRLGTLYQGELDRASGLLERG